MTPDQRQQLSALESDLQELLKPARAEDRLAQVWNIMEQMADQPRERTIVTTYPACNSEV